MTEKDETIDDFVDIGVDKLEEMKETLEDKTNDELVVELKENVNQLSEILREIDSDEEGADDRIAELLEIPGKENKNLNKKHLVKLVLVTEVESSVAKGANAIYHQYQHVTKDYNNLNEHLQKMVDQRDKYKEESVISFLKRKVLD